MKVLILSCNTGEGHNSAAKALKGHLDAHNEECVIFAKKYLQTHPDIDCFIFGHRHIDEDIKLSDTSRCIFLGDWIGTFAYVVFDGTTIERKHFIEGESKDL